MNFKETRNFIIRMALQGTALFFVYQCFRGYKKEQIVQEARHIRDQQIKYGANFELTPERQKILDEADTYLQNHSGLMYINRSRTRQFVEEKAKALIEEKQEAMDQIPEGTKPELAEELRKEIEELNKVYTYSKPKYTSFKDFQEPEVEDDKLKYYEKK